MARSGSLRRRLEAILDRRRGDFSAARDSPAEPSCASSRPAPLRFGRLPRPSALVRVPCGDGRVVLEEAVAGRVVEVEDRGGGSAFVIERTARAPAGARARGDLFFDIEATGLSSSPLFLIGVLEVRGEELLARLFLARDYSEEAAAITLFSRAADSCTRLVSFNGKSYDLPYIRMRAAATRVPFSQEKPHLDLLHAARRAFGDSLPDCKLQTLEREVLGKPRAGGDIPGAEIPDAYHAFVRTGDARDVVRILEHNFRDLVSLVSILARVEA